MKFLSTLSFLFFLLVTLACSVKGDASEDEWVSLFNGKDFSNWDIKIKGYPLNENKDSTFRVINGVMQVNYDQYSNWDARYGHIFYKQKFKAYLLSLEYRFTDDQLEGGAGWAFRNSGAMLHSQPPETMGLNQDFPVSIEAQFLGGNGNAARTTGNLCTPGTHVNIGDTLYTPHCISAQSKTYHGDQWVKFEALVLGDSIVKHMVEGDTVLVYTKPQVDGSEDFSPEIYQDGQPLEEGYISLQSESHPVEFKNIKLFNLEKYMHNPEELHRVIRELQKRKENL